MSGHRIDHAAPEGKMSDLTEPHLRLVSSFILVPGASDQRRPDFIAAFADPAIAEYADPVLVVFEDGNTEMIPRAELEQKIKRQTGDSVRGLMDKWR